MLQDKKHFDSQVLHFSGESARHLQMTRKRIPSVDTRDLPEAHKLRNQGLGGRGLPKRLQYYIGGSCQKITVLHRGGLAK